MHYIPVKRDIKKGTSSLYLLLCDFFFLLFLLLSKPSANKKSGISALYLLLCGFFLLLFLLFCHETKFHSGNSSMLCQLQLPSPQLHLTTMMEQQKSNGADGTWGRSTGKNENTPIHVLFIRGSQIDTFGWRTQQNCVQTQRDGVHTP